MKKTDKCKGKHVAPRDARRLPLVDVFRCRPPRSGVGCESRGKDAAGAYRRPCPHRALSPSLLTQGLHSQTAVELGRWGIIGYL